MISANLLVSLEADAATAELVLILALHSLLLKGVAPPPLVLGVFLAAAIAQFALLRQSNAGGERGRYAVIALLLIVRSVVKAEER